MGTFRLDIITPERTAFSEPVHSVYAPTPDGVVGILPGHMPIFTALTDGEIRITSDKGEFFLAVGGGFMEVTSERVAILVSRAVHAEEINEEEIKKAMESAKHIIERQVKNEEYATAQAVMRRSILELSLLKRRQRKTYPV